MSQRSPEWECRTCGYELAGYDGAGAVLCPECGVRDTPLPKPPEFASRRASFHEAVCTPVAAMVALATGLVAASAATERWGAGRVISEDFSGSILGFCLAVGVLLPLTQAITMVRDPAWRLDRHRIGLVLLSGLGLNLLVVGLGVLVQEALGGW